MTAPLDNSSNGDSVFTVVGSSVLDDAALSALASLLLDALQAERDARHDTEGNDNE